MSTTLFQTLAVLLPLLVAAGVIGIGLLWLALAVSTVGALPRLHRRLTPQMRSPRLRVAHASRCGLAHRQPADNTPKQVRHHRTPHRAHRDSTQ